MCAPLPDCASHLALHTPELPSLLDLNAPWPLQVVEQFNAQRKMARLQRWMAGSKVLSTAGLQVDEEMTIEAAEIWLYAVSSSLVQPVVVLPFHSFKNGLRPWTSLSEKMKLKDMKSVQLITFQLTHLVGADKENIFTLSDPKLERK